MGILIALEGLDGAGKRTLVDKVVRALRADGRTVATLDFPRYGRSVHADLAAEALKGSHGDLAASANAMAVLFALDRAGAAGELRMLIESNDLVLLDRYVASNAAYGAARTRQDAEGAFATWIAELEFGRLDLPVPDLQLLLDVPVELATQRAHLRGASDAARSLDAYERDSDLQARTGDVYRELAERDWQGAWWVVGPDTDASELAARMTELW